MATGIGHVAEGIKCQTAGRWIVDIFPQKQCRYAWNSAQYVPTEMATDKLRAVLQVSERPKTT
jgi:hypothetical protein